MSLMQVLEWVHPLKMDTYL